MTKDQFNHRKARVMEARASLVQRARNPLPAQLAAIGVALTGAVAAFFLLKGATLAYFGPEEFTALMAPLTGTDPQVASAGLHVWLGAVDPVSDLVARTLRPGL